MSAIVSLKTALDSANPNNLPDALKKVALGTMIAGKKVTVAGAAASASIALSPPALSGTVQLRITAGAAAAGPRQISDVGATLSATVARISDDGATLTIEDTCTGYVVSYVPRPTDAELAANLYPET